ncbi:HupE/UreJ family protein [Lewinella sp. LCG006]|uniref:HupE/UreJ family protein n=1 Tax=Lewinella sp. LCG006 TaxID=3231911 RepID=UPI0034608367
MENTFLFYFQLGWQHIVDWAALDHILFLGALCAVYTLVDWRRVLLLVTAFTIGHCLTLVLAGTDSLRLPADWVEMLIPATIMLTAVYNLSVNQDRLPDAASSSVFPTRLRLVYFFALLFGLIHGLGFSNTFRSMLFPGEEQQLVIQLLGFNLGIELGQVLIVVILLSLAYLFVEQFNLAAKKWNWLLSGGAFLVASMLFFERLLTMI